MSFRLSNLTAVHRLAAARLVSVTGGDAAYIALVALVYDRTGSPLWVSAALLAMIGVGGLAAPFAGMLGDRVDRRRVLIGSDLTAAVLFLAIAFVEEPWQLVVLAASAVLLALRPSPLPALAAGGAAGLAIALAGGPLP